MPMKKENAKSGNIGWMQKNKKPAAITASQTIKFN